MKYNLLFGLGLTIMANCALMGCDEDNDYPDYPIDAKIVTDFDEPLPDGITWINSQREFDEATITTDPTEIDFDNAVLIVAKGTLEEGGVVSASGKWNMVTQGIHRINVNVEVNNSSSIKSWYVAFLLPKNIQERVWLDVDYSPVSND